MLSATLSADDCIAYSAALWTAAMVGGGLQMGLSIPAAGLTFPPFVRGQAGQMQSGDERFGVSGFAGGLTIARKL